MGRYVVEIAPPRQGWHDVPALASSTRRAAAEVSAAGSDVRLLRAVFVPEEGTCLLVYEADAPDRVRAAAARAGLMEISVDDAVRVALPEATTDEEGA